MKKQPVTLIFLCIIGFIFLLFFFRLFMLGYRTGEVYPPYSTYLSEPKGTRVLYESLRKTEGLEVSRNLVPLQRFQPPEKCALFVIGLSPWSIRVAVNDEIERLDKMLSKGRRLIITMKPVSFDTSEPEEESEEDIKKETENEKKENRFISLEKHWDFEIEGLNFEENENNVLVEPKPGINSLRDAEALKWYSTAWFQIPTNDIWRVIASRGDKPVMIERDWKDGSIVLCSDSYFLSNESLFYNPPMPWLLYLIGNHQHLVFDEVHHDIHVNPGIAALVRKYHLGGTILVLGILASLYIWSHLFSLVPFADEKEKYIIHGQDQSSGLINLLTLYIRKKNILKACLELWKKDTANQHKLSRKRIEKMEKQARIFMAAEKPISPGKAYNEFNRLLYERENHGRKIK